MVQVHPIYVNDDTFWKWILTFINIVIVHIDRTYMNDGNNNVLFIRSLFLCADCMGRVHTLELALNIFQTEQKYHFRSPPKNKAPPPGTNLEIAN